MILRILTLFLLSVAAHGIAFADNTLCIKLLLDKDIDVGTDGLHSFGETKRTLKLKATRHDESGKATQFLIERLDDQPWGSLYNPTGYNPQGNPQWIFKVLGPRISRILGFEILNGKEMLVPSATRLMKGISALNTQLRELGYPEIEFGYYEQEESRQPLLTYLTKWLVNTQLPIADIKKDFNHYIHDISFHVPSAFLLPKTWTDRLKARIQHWMELDKIIRKKSDRFLGRPDHSQYVRIANGIANMGRMLMTRHLDDLSGITPVIIEIAHKETLLSDPEQIGISSDNLAVMKNVFKHANGDVEDLIHLENYIEDQFWDLENDLKDFRQDLTYEFARLYNDLAKDSLIFSIDEYIRYVSERQRQWNEAAIRFERGD